MLAECYIIAIPIPNLTTEVRNITNYCKIWYEVKLLIVCPLYDFAWYFRLRMIFKHLSLAVLTLRSILWCSSFCHTCIVRTAGLMFIFQTGFPNVVEQRVSTFHVVPCSSIASGFFISVRKFGWPARNLSAARLLLVSSLFLLSVYSTRKFCCSWRCKEPTLSVLLNVI